MSLKNLAPPVLSTLAAFLTMLFVAATPAQAVIKPSCEIGDKIGPTSDRLASEAMGIGYKAGIPMVIILMVVLVFAFNSRHGSTLMGSIFKAVGVLVALGFIVGVLTTVVAPPC